MTKQTELLFGAYMRYSTKQESNCQSTKIQAFYNRKRQIFHTF